MSEPTSPSLRPGPEPSLPGNPREVLELTPLQRLAFGSAIALGRLSGRWRRTARRTGDLERMRFLDMAYWMAKAEHPIERARETWVEAELDRPPAALDAAPAPGSQVSGQATLVAVGDLLPHPYLAGSTGLHDAVAPWLHDADLRLANLECVL